MCRSGGMSAEQRAEIDAAERMEPVNFSTPHGSQNVTNPNYATYTDSYPDLVANYNANWKGKGVSKAEFGAMHWNQHGRKEGRSMPGVSSVPVHEPSGGSRSGGSSSPSGLLPIGPYPGENVYFPMLTSRYERPQAYDLPDYMAATANLGAYMPANPFMGDGGLLYQPGTEQYADAYPINTGILEYQPPQFAVGPVQFYGAPFGPIEVTPPEELFGNEEEEEEDQKDGTGGSTPVGGIGTGGPEGVTGITAADMHGMNLGINSSTMSTS